MSQDSTERPANRLATAAFVLAALAVLGCLAAGVIALHASHLHPSWRASELASRWCSWALVPAVLAAFVASVLALVVWSSPSFRQWRNGWMATVALLVSLLIGLGAMAAPTLRRSRGSRVVQCLSNVKNIALALNMYAVDYDSFPESASWCETLTAYLGTPDIYRCNEAPELRSAYAYNRALAGIKFDRLANADRLVSVFESDGGWNAHGGPDLLPQYPRHSKGDYYGFADGSAKWYARKSKLVPGQSEPQWLKAPKDTPGPITWEPKLKTQQPAEGTHE